MNLSNDSVAALVARFLRARGVERVLALCGGHVMPIWMKCDAEGIQIVDDLPDALKRALANVLALLDVAVTPEAASSDTKTGLAWVPDLQPFAA